MALPKLNDKPKYELTVPSTGKRVRYRPYLVKEEKVLMMALESGDKNSALNAVVDTIESCITEDLERSSLTIFDIEYMFIMIRSKSVGEVSQIGVKCQKCETVNEISVQLDNVEIPKITKNHSIDLTDTISIKMRYPTFTDIASLENEKLSGTEKVFKLISRCIESVTTDDEHILLKDVADSEVTEFIESLSSGQFTKIKEFVENIPNVQKDISFTCKSCLQHNEVILKGIDDFF
jgi:hypothetical protein